MIILILLLLLEKFYFEDRYCVCIHLTEDSEHVLLLKSFKYFKDYVLLQTSSGSRNSVRAKPGTMNYYFDRL